VEGGRGGRREGRGGRREGRKEGGMKGGRERGIDSKGELAKYDALRCSTHVSDCAL